MKKQVIFVADDFGMNAEINKAILHANLYGGLHGTALMMAQPGTEEAVAWAQENPGLQIGWHLHLNDSQPATLAEWPWGNSPARAGIAISTTREAQGIMRREIERQWELFRQTGLPCRFVNCHHHLHAHPLILRTLMEVLGPDFPGWIRLGRVRFFSPGFRLFDSSRVIDACFSRHRKLSTWRSPDTLWGIDRLFAMNSGEVRAAMATLPDGFHEFIFHPRTLSCPDTQCLLDLQPLQNR